MKPRYATIPLALFALGVSLAVFGAPDAAAKPKNISIASGSPGGSWFPINAGMAQIFIEAGVRSNADVGGGISNVVRVGAGQFELGMTHALIPAIAREGKKPFKEKITNVRGAAALIENFQHIGVRINTGINSIAELKGKKFASQAVGNTTQYAFAQLLEAYGMSEEKDLVLSRGSQTYGANAVKDRNVVGFTAFTNIPTGNWTELFIALDMKLLGITQDIYAKMKAKNPAYKLTTIRAGSYKGVDKDVTVLGTSTMLIVNEATSADDVYWMVKTLAENMGKLRRNHASMRNVTTKSMADLPGFPMHEGALRYYKEAGVLK
jgi:TRAP transporter TAXI family solute receptor